MLAFDTLQREMWPELRGEFDPLRGERVVLRFVVKTAPASRTSAWADSATDMAAAQWGRKIASAPNAYRALSGCIYAPFYRASTKAFAVFRPVCGPRVHASKHP